MATNFYEVESRPIKIGPSLCLPFTVTAIGCWGCLMATDSWGIVLRNWRVQRILHTTTKEISSILFQTFVDLHNKSIVPVAMLNQAGGSAISMLKIGKTLYISDLGDSVTFVVRYDEINVKDFLQIVYQTKPHKPDDPLERRRIALKPREDMFSMLRFEESRADCSFLWLMVARSDLP